MERDPPPLAKPMCLRGRAEEEDCPVDRNAVSSVRLAFDVANLIVEEQGRRSFVALYHDVVTVHVVPAVPDHGSRQSRMVTERDFHRLTSLEGLTHACTPEENDRLKHHATLGTSVVKPDISRFPVLP
jgi:hypothetical protein